MRTWYGVFLSIRLRSGCVYFGRVEVCINTATTTWSASSYATLKTSDLARGDQLHQPQFLQCFKLDSTRDDTGAARTNLKELFGFGPLLECSECTAACVVIRQVVVIMQVGERGVDVGYWDEEHGQGRREVAGCDTGLVVE